MSLAETIQQKLADQTPQAGRHDLALAEPDAGWSLHLTLERQDELGCLVWELALHRVSAVPAEETLRSWADRIVQQATGLLEPLTVLEIDAERNEGLLRSEKPSRRKDKSFYYEVLLQGTRSLILRRYQTAAEGASKRTQVAFALTNDGLAKLADDLSR